MRSAGLLVLVAGVLALVLSGCGGGGVTQAADADLTQGKQLFSEKCASCHTLTDANAQGTIGPNLDDAFRFSREQGFDEETILNVVREQIAFPGLPVSNEAGPPMPDQDELGLSDAQAVDIAGYVARYAGNPEVSSGGGEVTATDGEAIFSEAGCGSCHTLAAAGSSGTVGPNLDDAKPSLELAVDRVTNGQGAMPSFEDQLSEEQIQAVAEFVAQSAGG